MAGRILLPPERALQHAKESRRFVARILLRASGEQRLKANNIAHALDAAIHQLEAFIAEGQ